MTDTAQTAATLDPATVPGVDANVEQKEMKFRWKKDKLGNQRKAIEVKGLVPSVEGIANIFNAGGKGLELLQEIMFDTVRGAVADYLAGNEAATGESIPWADFTWDKIANQPREDRRASSIPEETWAEFAKDYIEVMPGVTNKNVEAVTNATVVYLKKFAMVKTDKAVLSKLKDQLALYVDNSKNAEQFTEILELLNKKLETYLKSDDVAQLVANL